MRKPLLYDPKFLVKCLISILAIIALMRVTAGVGFLVAFLVFFSCFSRRNADLLFYTLIMTITITMSNGNIVVKSGIFGYSQRILMLTLSAIMIVRIAGSRKSPCLTPLLTILWYVFYMIVPSANGWSPIISYLKIFLFLMVFIAYFGVANYVVNSDVSNSRKVRSIFLMMAIYFIFGSILLIPFPSISQLSWQQVEQMIQAGQTVTSLFTGMTFHSQALGPLCSAMGVMLFADLAFSIKKLDKLYLALLLCVPILIWKTSSRTAMGSFLAGIAFTTFFLMRARNVRSSWKSKVVSTILVIVMLVSMLVLMIPSARDSAAGFILKFGQDDKREVTFEEVTATRRGKWDSALYNFHQKPMIGNGFQVDEEMQGLNFSLTTMSAPVEKGVWITAVLEEGGVFGFVLFSLFVVTSFASLLKYKCYQGLVGFFMLILINLGEFTIFSMTATGGLLWAIVFIGIILDVQRMRDEKFLMAPMGGYRAY